jgi:hypothetical protein
MGRSVDHTFPELEEVVASEEGVTPHEVPPPDCGGGSNGPGTCAPVAALTCGFPVSGDTLGPAATSDLDGYPCNVGNYDGPELVYEWTAPSNAPVEVLLLGAAPAEVNHDLFVLDGGTGVCSASQCVAHGFNSLEFSPLPGNTYYIVVDGFAEDAGAFEVMIDCGGTL